MIAKSYVVFEGVDIVGWTQGFIDLTLKEIEEGTREVAQNIRERAFCVECLYEFPAKKGKKFCSHECGVTYNRKKRYGEKEK